MNFKNRSHRSASTEPEINLIPFIDVLLVVVIFLMLSTTYSKFTEVELKLPTADVQAAKDRPNEIMVSVNSAGIYSVDKQVVAQRGVLALTSALNAASKRMESSLQGKAPIIVINADASAEQQHGLALELARGDGFLRRQRVVAGQRGHERLVVQRRDSQAGVGKGLGQDGTVDLAGAQHLQQLDGEVLLQHQRHLGRQADRIAHQVRQKVGADGVDHAQFQGAGQRVLAALGDVLDGGRLLQHALRLAHDLLAQRRDADLAGAALEQLDVQLVFELADRHRQRRLRDEAGLGRLAEVLLARHGDDVFEFGEGHGDQAFR